MNNLTYEDLEADNTIYSYLEKTPYKIVEIKLHRYDSELNEYCHCGCQQKPIGDIFIFIQKSSYIRKYGLRLYPTRECSISILNCDQRGASIKKTLYDSIKSWHNSIKTPLERQLLRTNSLKRELCEKTFKPEHF